LCPSLCWYLIAMTIYCCPPAEFRKAKYGIMWDGDA
jgi:hypothetical protein